MVLFSRTFQQPRNAFQRSGLNERADGHLPAEYLLDPEAGLHERKGIAAKCKKIVRPADLAETKQFRPDCRELLLYRPVRQFSISSRAAHVVVRWWKSFTI